MIVGKSDVKVLSSSSYMLEAEHVVVTESDNLAVGRPGAAEFKEIPADRPGVEERWRGKFGAAIPADANWKTAKYFFVLGGLNLLSVSYIVQFDSGSVYIWYEVY